MALTSSLFIKKSTVSGTVPLLSEITSSELGINLGDGTLYYSDVTRSLVLPINAGTASFVETASFALNAGDSPGGGGFGGDFSGSFSGSVTGTFIAEAGTIQLPGYAFIESSSFGMTMTGSHLILSTNATQSLIMSASGIVEFANRMAIENRAGGSCVGAACALPTFFNIADPDNGIYFNGPFTNFVSSGNTVGGFASDGLYLPRFGVVGWSSDTNVGTQQDTRIYRQLGSPGVIEFREPVIDSPHALLIFGTWDDVTDNEFLALRTVASGTVGDYVITPDRGGAGILRDLQIGTASIAIRIHDNLQVIGSASIEDGLEVNSGSVAGGTWRFNSMASTTGFYAEGDVFAFTHAGSFRIGFRDQGITLRGNSIISWGATTATSLGVLNLQGSLDDPDLPTTTLRLQFPSADIGTKFTVSSLFTTSGANREELFMMGVSASNALIDTQALGTGIRRGLTIMSPGVDLTLDADNVIVSGTLQVLGLVTGNITTASFLTGSADTNLIGPTGSDDLTFRTNDTNRWKVVSSSGAFAPAVDKGVSIGVFGGPRPKDLDLGRKMRIFRDGGGRVSQWGAEGGSNNPSLTIDIDESPAQIRTAVSSVTGTAAWAFLNDDGTFLQIDANSHATFSNDLQVAGNLQVVGSSSFDLITASGTLTGTLIGSASHAENADTAVLAVSAVTATTASNANTASFAEPLLFTAHRPVLTVVSSSVYNVLFTDYLLLIDASSGTVATDVVLPDTADFIKDFAGKEITITKIDASVNDVQLMGSGTQTIIGDPTTSLTDQYQGLTLIPSGGIWWAK